MYHIKCAHNRLHLEQEHMENEYLNKLHKDIINIILHGQTSEVLKA